MSQLILMETFSLPKLSSPMKLVNDIFFAPCEILMIFSFTIKQDHIEPSWRHLPEYTDKHMIAYRASDVRLSWKNHEHEGHFEPGKCGYVKEGSELETDEDDEEDPEVHAEAYSSDDSSLSKQEHKSEKRSKRQADQYEYTPTKTRCPLLLVADYRFFQEMGSSNTKTTISYLISLIDRGKMIRLNNLCAV